MSNDRTSPETETLLPCPFCGNDLYRSPRAHNPKAYCVTEDCYGKRMSVVNLDDPVIVAMWNRRDGLATRPDLWRPIETAPHSTLSVLISGRYPNGSWYVEESYRHPSGHFNGRKIDPPTHCMPLPQGPDTSTDRTSK